MKKKQILTFLFLITSIFSVLAQDIVGKATYYANFFQGRRTSSGEIFDQRKMTCAHLSLPFGTYLRVHNPANGKTVVVKVNDRGPYNPRAVIDLSRAAAEKLGMVRQGIVKMEITIIKAPNAKEIFPLNIPEFSKKPLLAISDGKSWNDAVKKEEKDFLNNLKSVEWNRFVRFQKMDSIYSYWKIKNRLMAEIETK